MTECNQQTFGFQALGKRKVEADLQGGNLSLILRDFQGGSLCVCVTERERESVCVCACV